MDEWIKRSIDVIKPYATPIELKGIQFRLKSACDKDFYRGASELAVARYYAEQYPDGILLPRGNKNDKDIDVSFLSGGQRINIEVKCPDLSYDQSKKFTLHAPYMYEDLNKGKETERYMSETMGNDLNVDPNKLLNFKKFLGECKDKFNESAENGDINIVLFSMLELDWMDDYRVKIEDEGLLSEYSSIHAVVLSDCARRHHRGQERFRSGFQSCFNYIVPNIKHTSAITPEQLKLAVSCIPNHTNEAKAWYSELVKEDDPIGIMVKGFQRLELFNNIALESGHMIEGVSDEK
tara:strand:+ start:10825 stop:11703 length:879 start_codon:yes stop_codon:yes gene_type:complete